MRRRSPRGGFALLAVLWTVAMAAVLSGTAMIVARTGAQTTRNRVLLARAEWAREACAEILMARYADDRTVRKLDRIDLGHGTWCQAEVSDPGSKLNINTAPIAPIRSLLFLTMHNDARAESLANSIDAVRQKVPFLDPEDLIRVPGIDRPPVDSLAKFLTTRGTGTVNLNVAPGLVLQSIPGMTEEAVAVILSHQALGLPIGGVSELASLLSRNSQNVLEASYREFGRVGAFAPTQLIGTVEGGVHGTPIRVRVVLTLVAAGARLAVIRRETE